jgi:2,3-bisphosphoglycerate-independent phosphoglycerate mutase
MVTLIILDGLGIRKDPFGNAVAKSGLPHLSKLFKKYPYTLLKASGNAVGLPDGQMGNSEVGHFTMGTGQIVYQDLERINQAIKCGEFEKNEALDKCLKFAEKNKSNFHIMGLVSNGGVHSSLEHLDAIIEQTKKYKIKNIFIHAITDGRDTPIQSGISFLEELNNKISGTNIKIATICGRVYTMDREQRYDRVERAYKLYTDGIGDKFNSYKDAMEKSYANGKNDEFVEPILLEKDGLIKDNDSVLFFNFRSDRAREITTAFTDKEFNKFKTKKFKNLMYTCMTEYSSELSHLNTLFPPVHIQNNLSCLISKAGLKQYHIAETTKYAHVTFFFNGGIEEANKNEDRKLIDSIAVQDFSFFPQMRANEITLELLEVIASREYDFHLVNYSNPDMVGHTGNFNSTVEAVNCVDKNAYAVALATLMAGGTCIITADHGNAELMFDEHGNKITAHTTNLVPFCIVSENKYKIKKKNGGLSNIAPTILKIMGLEIPEEMDIPLI